MKGFVSFFVYSGRFLFLARLLASFMGGKNIVAGGGVGVPFAKLSLEEEERVFFAQAEDSEFFFFATERRRRIEKRRREIADITTCLLRRRLRMQRYRFSVCSSSTNTDQQKATKKCPKSFAFFREGDVFLNFGERENLEPRQNAYCGFFGGRGVPRGRRKVQSRAARFAWYKNALFLFILLRRGPIAPHKSYPQRVLVSKKMEKEGGLVVVHASRTGMVFLAVGVVSWPYFSRLQNPLYIIFGNAHLIGISFSTSPPFSALFLLVLRSSVCITCNISFLGVYIEDKMISSLGTQTGVKKRGRADSN